MHHCYTGLNTHHFTAFVIAYQLIGKLLTSVVFCADTVRFQHMVSLWKYWELSDGYGLATVGYLTPGQGNSANNMQTYRLGLPVA